MIINKYPYTNFHELNLDWIIEQLKRYDVIIDNLDNYIDDAIDKKLSETTLSALSTQILNVQQMPDGYVSALGDGFTDDTARIEAAITYANNNSMLVYCPPGNYMVNNINVDEVKVGIFGASPLETIFTYNGDLGSEGGIFSGSISDLSVLNVGFKVSNVRTADISVLYSSDSISNINITNSEVHDMAFIISAASIDNVAINEVICYDMSAYINGASVTGIHGTIQDKAQDLEINLGDLLIKGDIHYKAPAILNDYFSTVAYKDQTGTEYKVLVQTENTTQLSAITENAVNVKDYGATGDGSTDDGPAIRTALNMAMTSGMPLYFPKGTYIIDEDPAYPNYDIGLRIRDGSLLMYGDGAYNSIIKTKSGSYLHLIHITDCNGIDIRDLTIDGGINPANPVYSSSIFCHNIRLANVRNVTIRDCVIQNSVNYGIGIQAGRNEHIIVDNCKFYNTGADCIDAKNLESTNRDIKLTNLYMEKPGMNNLYSAQRAQVCIDIRGEKIIIDNIYIDGLTDSKGGIRMRPTSEEQGVGGRYSVIQNVTINGSSSNTAIGIDLVAEGCNVNNCYISRMHRAIHALGNFQSIDNVFVDRIWDTGFHIEGYGNKFNNITLTTLNLNTSVKGFQFDNAYTNLLNNIVFSNCGVAFRLADRARLFINNIFARGTITTPFSGDTSQVTLTNNYGIAI